MFAVFVFAILLPIAYQISLDGNNACRTFDDYLNYETSKNCWHNPDMILRTPELIEKYAGKPEYHKVLTDDGYILGIFRLPPRENPKGSILLLHTMFTESKLFMSQRNESTALLLWRDGYDVWLYNQRGTFHSPGHVNMSIEEYKYWNFSFDELALYDIPSTINLIRSKTPQHKVFIFGSSLATTNALVYGSLLPEHTKENVQAFILAGTSCFYRFGTSLTSTLYPLFAEPLKALDEALQMGNMLPALPLIQRVLRYASRAFPITPFGVHLSNMFIFGWTPDETDPAFLNLDVTLYMANTPWKMAIHYLQIGGTKTRFQQYDYGRKDNMKVYGTVLPPEYPLEKIRVPVFLISGSGDILTHQGDSQYLYDNVLHQDAKKYKPVVLPGINHGDYHYGRSRKELLVKTMLDFMEKARKDS